MVAVSLRLAVQAARQVAEDAYQHLRLGVLLWRGRPAHRYGDLGQRLYSVRERLRRQLSDRPGFGSFEFSGATRLAVSGMRRGQSVFERSGGLGTRFQTFVHVFRSREGDASGGYGPRMKEAFAHTPFRISVV